MVVLRGLKTVFFTLFPEVDIFFRKLPEQKKKKDFEEKKSRGKAKKKLTFEERL